MIEMRNRQIPFRYVDSGQHAELTRSLRRVFNLPEPDFCLRRGAGDIVSIRGAAFWYTKYMWKSLIHRKSMQKELFPSGGICLIHGDTLSTLLGMQLARRAGLKVGHVEAGLRSFRIWDPFPEELIRIYCMQHAHVLFAPSDEAVENLSNMQIVGRVVKAHGNTVADSLRLMDNVSTTAPIPNGPFALATCHRLETITKKDRLRQVVSLLNRVAKQMPVVFVTHKPTRKYLQKFGLDGILHAEITCLEMQDYCDFVALIKAAQIVLTDGGSIQEECAYLNKPCLILRKTTERPDGLGKNARLWGFDNSAAETFLAETKSLKPADTSQLPHPSAKIVDTLIQMGYAANRGANDLNKA